MSQIGNRHQPPFGLLPGLLLCIVLLIPSYFINNGTSHDWGGDFALYVRQALNMVDGTPQTDNGYIYNPECPGLGPKTYPVGFPMLLTPVVAWVGNDMAALIDYMALLYILFGAVVFLWLQGEVGFIAALVVALGISYHPDLLQFKREVMSDMPFALLTLLTLIAVRGKKWLWALPFVILASVTRTVGVSLFVAWGLWLLWQYAVGWDDARTFLRSNRSVLILLFAVVGYGALNHLLFITDTETGYRSLFGRGALTDVISGNFTFYTDFLRSFLFAEHGFGSWADVGLLAFLVLVCLGWVRRLIRQPGLAELWAPIYLLVLLIYPYRGAGLRFMLPLLPLLFHYMVVAVQVRPKRWRFVPVLIVLVPFLFQARHTVAFAQHWPQHVSGPQNGTAQEVFAFIRDNTTETDRFLFIKPRVLALYTYRDCMSNERYQSVSSIVHQLDTAGIGYLLTTPEIANPGLDSLLLVYPERTSLSFENSDFKLYRWE